MASAVEVPVVVRRGTLSRSIEAEAMTAARTLGRSGSRAVQPLGQMLGKIRSNADEFTKSIEASNARVIAFGASVAVINGMSRAFRELVSTTIRVEKTLADINVVLNTTQKGIEKFGDGIFKVAKNTAQSFDVAAEAALEFSRQGLSTEETLKRVNDALILTRLTGLKASESVKGLTAAVNGFGKAGLTTTQIINKLSAVDVQFAVGTDDLINALSRAGAVAQDAGVSFDELVAMVTVAQQRTARGGAVIGNAFKTIYTRLQDPKALNALREVRIAVDDVSGAALPANQVLKGLADSYDNLTRTQKATIDQFVAGKFQINILKAALGDLGKANSDYSRAQLVSANATDQAIVKNKQLNQTAAALTAQTGVAIEQLVKKIGDISIGPGIKNLLTTVNSLIESMTKGLEGESIGATFAKNLLKGIGGVLTGPGLIVVGGVFIKLFKDLVVFGTRSLKNLLGLNNAAKQQAAIQEGISQLLAKNVAFQNQMAAASGNVARQQAITNRFLAEEVALRTRSASMGASLAAGAFAGGFRVSGGGDLTRRRGLRGRIPGFAPMLRPGTQIPGLKRRTDQMVPLTSASALGVAEGGIQRGMYDITASAGQIAKHGFGYTTKRDRLGTNNAPAVILQDMQKGGTPLGGGMQGPSAPHPGFSMRTRLHGTSSEAAVVSDIASYLNKASTRDLFRQRQIKNSEGQKVNITDAQIDSVIAAHRGSTNLASLDGRLKEVDAGVRGHYQQIMADKVIEQSTARNLETALTRVGGTNVRLQGGRQGADTPIDAMMGMFPLELKKRITGSNTGPTSAASMIAKHITSTTQPQFRRELYDHASRMNPPMTQALDDYIQKMHENFYRAYHDIASRNQLFNQREAGSLFSQNSTRMSPKDMADAVRQYHGIMNFAPNFSPLSDAIAREKQQVGSMMGISPSDVRTRVVQNNVLRSPFNPQGFGVISPTVGQNNFADAARMHRGEDLKTANLPNFNPLRSGTGDFTPGTAPVNPYKLVPMSVKVVEEAPKVIKDRMSAAEAVRRTTAATTPRPGGAVISIPDSSLTPSGPASRTRMQRFTGAMGTATRGVGAGLRGLGGPAMTAAFMYPMVEPYLPQGADAMARFGMTGDQRVASMRRRRQATGAAIGGFGAGAMASSALAALSAANTFNPALPLRLGIMGLTAAGGAYLGSEVAPGIGEKFLGDAELSADDYGNISQQFADKARGDQDSLSAYERAYSQFLAADTSAAKGSKAKELMKIISGVNDPQLRTELTNVLQSNQTTAKQDPDSVRNQFSKIRRESADRGMSGAFYARTQQIRTRAAGRADGPKLGTMTVKEKQDLESTLVAMSDKDFAALQAVVMQGTGPGGLTQSEAFPRSGPYKVNLGDAGATSKVPGAAQGLSHHAFREAMTTMDEERDILIDDFVRRTGATKKELLQLNMGVAGVKDVFRGAADVRGNIQVAGTKAGGKGFTQGKDLYDSFLRNLTESQRSRALERVRNEGGFAVGRQYQQSALGLAQRFGYTGTTIAREQARMAKDQIDSQLYMDQRALRTGNLSQLPGLTASFGKFAGGAEASQFLQKLVEGGDVDSLRKFATAARTGPQETATLAGRFAGSMGMENVDKIQQGLKQADTKAFADFFNQIADKDEEFSAAAKGARDLQDALLDLANDTEKNGVLYTGIEAFRSELGNALHDISMNAKSGKEALQDFGLALVAAINRKVMDNLASSITEGIFGRFFGPSMSFGTAGELTDPKQKGGIITARNGMYISGNRTGDKNPALLEDGEYVLNRNAVKAMGGPTALDSINFGMAPRFQGGGLSLSDAYGSSFGLLGGLGDMSQYSLKPFEMETGMLTSPGLSYKPLATPSDIMELPPLPLPSIASMEAGRANPSGLKITGTSKKSGEGRKVFMTETGIGGGLKMYTFQKRAGQWREVGPGGKLSHNSGIKIWNFSVKDGKPTGLRYNRGTSAESRAGFPGFNSMNAQSLKGQIGKTLVPGFDEGGFFSGVSMKDRRAAEKEIGVAIDSSAYNVDGTGFMLANDPQMQRMMGFFQKRQQERFNKEYASQQKKDAFVQGLASTAIGFTLNAGIGAISEAAEIRKMEKLQPGFDKKYYKDLYRQGLRVEGSDLIRKQSGGYIDNIPAMLTGGEFVVNKNATQHYGTSYLNKINRMQDGGLVGGTGFEQGNGDVGSASSAPTTNHNNVGITVNFGADANPEVKTVQDGAAQDPQQFASKIRAAVMDVISQEQRVGGRLRSQKKGRR